MELIERYLGAVRWNLPAAKADDIIAELRDVLASRIEDREEASGRALTRDEIGALLKDFGHPLAVAGRYHGQRALIGPELFPFYWFVLRLVLVVVAVVEAIQLAGRVIGGSRTLVQALSQGIGDASVSLLLNAAVVTLVFAVIERSGWLATYLEQWRPDALPTLPRIEARPRRLWEPVLGIAFGAAFLAWWTGALPIDWMPRESDLAVHAAPIWATLHWPVAALIAARLAQDLASLLAPTWKPLRALLSLACAVGTVAIAALLYQAGRLVTVSPVSASAEQAANMQRGLDTALHIAVPVIGALAAWQCAVELWRLYRERR